MAEFPALPLFTDSLLADTGHLSHEEFGAYMRILILMWRTPECRIPVADAWLMRKLMCDPNKFNELFKPLFLEFMTSDGSFYRQKRLFKEFEYVRMMRVKNRGAAKSRWNKEKHPHSGNAPHPTPPTITVSDDTVIPLPLKTNLFPSAPSEKEKTHAKPRRTRKQSSHIDSGFSPDIDGIKLATDLGLENIERHANEFIDYWKGRGESRADWQATFRNRLRQIAQHRSERQQRPANGRPGVQDVTAATLRAIEIRQQRQA